MARYVNTRGISWDAVRNGLLVVLFILVVQVIAVGIFLSPSDDRRPSLPAWAPCEARVAAGLGIRWTPEDGATERLTDFENLTREVCQ